MKVKALLSEFSHSQITTLHYAPKPILETEFQKNPYLQYATTDVARHPGNHGTSVDIISDITSTGFQTDRFDLIICSHVLEHVYDDTAALQELRRMVRPNGYVLIDIPIDTDTTIEEADMSESDKAELLGDPTHVRACGEDYFDRIRDVGFTVNQLFADEIVDNPSDYGLQDDDWILICKA